MGKLKDAIQILSGKLKKIKQKKVKCLAPSEGMSGGDTLRHLLVRNTGIKECVFHFSIRFLQLFLEKLDNSNGANPLTQEVNSWSLLIWNI